MAGTIESLIGQVDERKEELVALLKTLVSYKTPAPPARNTSEAQHYIAHLLKQYGFEVDTWEVYPNHPNIVVGA